MPIRNNGRLTLAGKRQKCQYVFLYPKVSRGFVALRIVVNYLLKFRSLVLLVWGRHCPSPSPTSYRGYRDGNSLLITAHVSGFRCKIFVFAGYFMQYDLITVFSRIMPNQLLGLYIQLLA